MRRSGLNPLRHTATTTGMASIMPGASVGRPPKPLTSRPLRRPFFGTPSLATRLMPTPSSIGWFTTPIASISPARASDADALDRSEGIDYQPTTLPKIYCQQSARQPGDIISYRRATSSRNQRATSSESAGHERKGSVEPAAAT